MQRISKQLRDYIYERDGFKCLKCNTTEKLTLDHIIPKCDGGLDVKWNLQTLCEYCNGEKGSLTIDYRKFSEPTLITDCVGHCVNHIACEILGCCVYKHSLLAGKKHELNKKISPTGKIPTHVLVDIFQEIKPPKITGKEIWIDFAKERGIYDPAYEYMTKKQIKKNLVSVHKPKIEQKKVRNKEKPLPSIGLWEKQNFIIYKERKCFIYCQAIVPIISVERGQRGYYDTVEDKVIFSICGTLIVHYKGTLANQIKIIYFSKPRGSSVVPVINPNIVPHDEYQKQYYLQHQTPEQFKLAQKFGWEFAKMITEPCENFNYE